MDNKSKIIIIIACFLLVVAADYGYNISASIEEMKNDKIINDINVAIGFHELMLYENGIPVPSEDANSSFYFIEEDLSNAVPAHLVYLINVCGSSCSTYLDVFGEPLKIYKANRSVTPFAEFKEKVKDNWYLNNPGCAGFVTKRKELYEMENHSPSPCYYITAKMNGTSESSDDYVLLDKARTKCVADNGFEFYDNPQCIISDEEVDQMARVQYRDFVDELKSTAENVYEIQVPESLRDSGASTFKIDLQTKEVAVYEQPEPEYGLTLIVMLRESFVMFILKLLILFSLIVSSKSSLVKIKKITYSLLISGASFITVPYSLRAFDGVSFFWGAGAGPGLLAAIFMPIFVDILLLMALFGFSIKKSSVVSLGINIFVAIGLISVVTFL